MSPLKSILYTVEILPRISFEYNYIHLLFITQSSVLYFYRYNFKYFESIEDIKNESFFISSHQNNYQELEKLIGFEENEDCRIMTIKEDENTTFFIKLSNDDVIYISQQLNGDERLVQGVSLVSPKDKDYPYVIEYMNEDFVDVIFDEKENIDLLKLQ